MKRQNKTSPHKISKAETSRLGKITQILDKAYPNPRSELNFNNDYELLVSVALSAQCTDKKVNQVTPLLFSKYPNFKTLSKAKLTAVEEIIRPINYYRTKAKNIIAASERVESLHHGTLPKNHEELIELPGVGRKTANVVLGELGISHTFPVDTHVFRVSKRLGMASGKSVNEVEEEMKRTFPSNLWRSLHHWLILHGRRVCKAQRPLCVECPLNKLCPSAQD